jgi:hypothetical protein
MPERGDRKPGRSGGAGSLPGTALPIEALHQDAVVLDAAAFEARHGSGFLLVTALGGRGPESTNTTQLLFGSGDRAGHTADLAVVVYPLRQRAGAPAHIVTMGREKTHDVVISEMSVSRFHAFAQRDADGSFLIQDAGSTNGTTVNGASVLSRGVGPATRLKPGDTVRLGQVEFTFTDAPALRDFVRKAGG